MRMRARRLLLWVNPPRPAQGEFTFTGRLSRVVHHTAFGGLSVISPQRKRSSRTLDIPLGFVVTNRCVASFSPPVHPLHQLAVHVKCCRRGRRKPRQCQKWRRGQCDALNCRLRSSSFRGCRPRSRRRQAALTALALASILVAAWKGSAGAQVQPSERKKPAGGRLCAGAEAISCSRRPWPGRHAQHRQPAGCRAPVQWPGR